MLFYRTHLLGFDIETEFIILCTPHQCKKTVHLMYVRTVVFTGTIYASSCICVVAIGLVTNNEPRSSVHLTHLAIQATFANCQFPPLNYRQAPNSWSPRPIVTALCATRSLFHSEFCLY